METIDEFTVQIELRSDGRASFMGMVVTDSQEGIVDMLTVDTGEFGPAAIDITVDKFVRRINKRVDDLGERYKMYLKGYREMQG